MTALPVTSMTSFAAQGGFTLATFSSTRLEIYLATLSLVVAGACLFAAMDDSGRGVSREKWRPVGLFAAAVLLVLAGSFLQTELLLVGVVALAVGVVVALVVTL